MAQHPTALLWECYQQRRCNPATPGLQCDAGLQAVLFANGLEVKADTDETGDCGFDGFAISYLDGCRASSRSTTSKYKKLSGANRPARIMQLRDISATWMNLNADVQIWGGLTYRELALAMVHDRRLSFEDMLVNVKTPKSWADGSVLLALACYFDVDLCIWQLGVEPCLISCTLLGNTPSSDTPLISLAMQNDVHFWGVTRVAASVMHDVGDKGEWLSVPKPHVSDPSADCDCDPVIDTTPAAMSRELQDAEYALCKTLCSWNPWDTPSQQLISNIGDLAGLAQPSSLGKRCTLRSQVIQDLLHEEKNHVLPTHLQYHIAARYRLRNDHVSVANSHQRAMTILQHLETRTDTTLDVITQQLSKGCSTNPEKPHNCLLHFLENPGIVRNWRILWRSLPSTQRMEALIKQVQASLEKQNAKVLPTSRCEWCFLGQPVCRRAFLALAGVGNSSLTRAKALAEKGVQSCHSRKELQQIEMIRGGSHDQKYLDARAWLIVHADTHAELSPKTHESWFPSGRKIFYYYMYEADRQANKRPYASYDVFLTAWRCETPWIKIARSLSTFTQCGMCNYLKALLDETPRSQPGVLAMLKRRLVEHWRFQSAQRLCQSRIEEACAQNGQTKWFTKVDKMDQKKTSLPTEWKQLTSPLFKLGERMVVGIIGSQWSGPSHTSTAVRTIFQDCEQGSETQCSVLLCNLHEVAMKENHLPEELIVGADNTPKETKNSIVMAWAVWLLCCLMDTPLWSISFTFLLVGHTHDALDRFFSRLSVALIGKDYYTLEQMWSHITNAVKSHDISISHVTDAWAFKELQDGNGISEIKGVRHPHVFSIFRRGGVYIQWKQYMTDEVWSRPVLMLPPNLMRTVGALRPQRIDFEFKQKNSMLAWIDKLSMSLANVHGTCKHRARDLEWLRALILKKDPAYNPQISLDKLIDDLIAIGKQGSTRARASTDTFPQDQIAQLLPGADQVHVPPDYLMHISGQHDPPPPPPDVVIPGHFLIVKNTTGAEYHGESLLFLMGKLLPDVMTVANNRMLVEWWLPSRSPESNFRGGRRKHVVDLFAEWRPADSLPLSELAGLTLPPGLLDPQLVLITNVELADGKLSFHTLDTLRLRHGLDCTALSRSSTTDGIIYRNYVLMGCPPG